MKETQKKPGGRRVVAWTLAAAALMAAAQVRAQSAVLLEAGNERLREDLQWLAQHGVITLSTSAWPLPLAAVEAALAGRRPNITFSDREALAAVELELARQRKRLGLGVTVRGNTASLPTMGFDHPVRAKADVAARVQASSGPWAGRLELHGLADPFTPRQTNFNAEGSYLAGAWGGQVFYAGQIPHWWGPAQDGSLIWSNAALAIPGVGVRRATERPFETRWLSWLGPWSYEVFLGKMLHNRLVPGVRVVAMRLQAQPLPGLEVGLSRLTQWGGAISENGPRAHLRAVFSRPNEEGVKNNEIAGFDARYTWLPGGNPLSLYGQLIGEDESDLRPTNYIGIAGLQFKHSLAGARVQWHVETADTMSRRLFGLRDGRPNTAYVHTEFLDGMYHEGLPIGHFLGGDGKAHSLGVRVVPGRNPYRLRYGLRFVRADVNPSSQAVNLAFPSADTVKLVELNASWEWRVYQQPMKVEAGLGVLRSRDNGRDTGVRLGVEVPF
ncbi:MAG TPA: capsule assembly Wzi family protein [Ramlibacter sp.]|uniref:capsule assembly Wzi family protein n=1 Tax=Ramlibacter sp. TaxID=1917967 RepID=UPI002D803F31|nr:capsule assembly Wzi family protein [Ramlibacter sp.]HET8747554.1 capsule assembly Wzi family protein [Ramlibacter sp.]